MDSCITSERLTTNDSYRRGVPARGKGVREISRDRQVETNREQIVLYRRLVNEDRGGDDFSRWSIGTRSPRHTLNTHAHTHSHIHVHRDERIVLPFNTVAHDNSADVSVYNASRLCHIVATRRPDAAHGPGGLKTAERNTVDDEEQRGRRARGKRAVALALVVVVGGAALSRALTSETKTERRGWSKAADGDDPSDACDSTANVVNRRRRRDRPNEQRTTRENRDDDGRRRRSRAAKHLADTALYSFKYAHAASDKNTRHTGGGGGRNRETGR